jgi:RNA recognition motif-containing protein
MNFNVFAAISMISKLFVGGLSWDTTDGIALLGPDSDLLLIFSSSSEGLRDYFSQFGKVKPSIGPSFTWLTHAEG